MCSFKNNWHIRTSHSFVTHFGLEGRTISRKGLRNLQFIVSPPGAAKSHILDIYRHSSRFVPAALKHSLNFISTWTNSSATIRGWIVSQTASTCQCKRENVPAEAKHLRVQSAEAFTRLREARQAGKRFNRLQMNPCWGAAKPTCHCGPQRQQTLKCLHQCCCTGTRVKARVCVSFSRCVQPGSLALQFEKDFRNDFVLILHSCRRTKFDSTTFTGQEQTIYLTRHKIYKTVLERVPGPCSNYQNF